MNIYSPPQVVKKLVKLAQNHLSFLWCQYRKRTFETWITPQFVDGIDSVLADLGLPPFELETDPDCPYTGFLVAFNWRNQITSVEVPYLAKVDNPYHPLFCSPNSANDIYPLGGLDLSGIRLSDAELNCETDLEGVIDLTKAMRKAGLI